MFGFMDKSQVAGILNEIAVLLELKGENPFKSRAYINAARAIEGLTEPLEKVVAENRLDQIKGIGESIAQKITELVTTGKLAYYEELKASIPPGLIEMLEIPNLGPKRIKTLYDKLGIDSIEKLEKACKEGRVAILPGFGEKLQANILEGIQRARVLASKHLLVEAWSVAEPILNELRNHPYVTKCSVAGSLRRNKEVIGDIDFLVTSNKPKEVMEYFAGQPQVEKVLVMGETKASVLLQGGIQSDLRIVAEHEFPFALAYFTGSKEHNIVMRQRAIARGLRLNEYGLFRSKEETRDPSLLIPCNDETEIYERLGLHYIPPELREDHGEFEVAEKQPVPELVKYEDIKGSLHNHSTWSDGHQTLPEIVETMHAHGFKYWAITDHSKSAFQAGGLDVPTLKKQLAEIKKINQRLKEQGIDFMLLTGIEVDILKDGSLDLPDEILAELDVVIASVHSGFAGGEAEMTKRIIKAIQNPWVNILGHPTGRLLLKRDPYPVNIQAVIDACAETGTWIEFNCAPDRMDLDWRYWPYAKSKGVKCAIGIDAHSANDVIFLKLGVGTARKGWLTPSDVVNCLPIPQLLEALKQKRKRFNVA